MKNQTRTQERSARSKEEIESCLDAMKSDEDRHSHVYYGVFGVRQFASEEDRISYYTNLAEVCESLSEKMRGVHVQYTNDFGYFAARAWEKAGKIDEAVRIYSTHHSLGEGNIPIMWERLGDLERAVEGYKATGDVYKTREILEKLGRLEEAKKRYSHQSEDRARIHEKQGEPSKAADIYYTIWRDQPHNEWAREYYRSRCRKSDKLRAKAKIIMEETDGMGSLPHGSSCRDRLNQLNDPERSARIYEKAEMFYAAATMWEEAGNPDNARKAYERSNEVERFKNVPALDRNLQAPTTKA